MIHFDNVSKVYQQQQSMLLKDLLLGQQQESAPFTALHNISFTLGRGESLGVIGRNGAGKSTLLKLVAGVLDPDDGVVQVDGRVAALMDLGVGFHPELTGEENIRFSAAMLGFGRHELKDYTEKIIAFAELGDFIKRPIKTYSSGMSVRLAFAVAVHVDPDVLIIDEVLSVGDLRFQAKCIDKIVNFKNRGKTILFVSHALPQVSQLCDRALWLEQGRVLFEGAADEVVQAYTNGRVPAKQAPLASLGTK
jgi:ABC-type polysaccharide/polyol phosphate transport system ATPase subunit